MGDVAALCRFITGVFPPRGHIGEMPSIAGFRIGAGPFERRRWGALPIVWFWRQQQQVFTEPVSRHPV
ncbi:MAG: hypothetical protein ABI240_16280 [Sphingomonas sp.]